MFFCGICFRGQGTHPSASEDKGDARSVRSASQHFGDVEGRAGQASRYLMRSMAAYVLSTRKIFKLSMPRHSPMKSCIGSEAVASIIYVVCDVFITF